MNDSVFTHTQDQLKQLAQDVLAIAKETGASDASVAAAFSWMVSLAERGVTVTALT